MSSRPLPSSADSAPNPAPNAAAPGRAAATREALLAAAREEFAEHGIAGARVDRIAQRAGVNKERIYGYFGNKEKLFDAVIGRALDEFAAVTAGPEDDPVEYVGQLFDYYREHPDLLRLLMWEALYERPRAAEEEPSEAQRRRMDQCGGRLDALAERMGRESDPAVGRTLLTLKGLAMMPIAMPRIAALLGVEMDDPKAVAAMREHIMAFARTALENGAVDQS
ncbi:TetR family transcriptional regulator [Spirillospora sp. CA-253888]